MNRPFATIILAGGRGSRMGGTDKHKVCFEAGGAPVIARALDTYNHCGARCNVIVVGAQAESVMAVAAARFPGVIFAFQPVPRGTGDAARQGAAILERIQFEGDILLVAGDKLIEPCVVQGLLAAHRSRKADVTLATAPRPPGSSTGILITNGQGRVASILEEAERQRLLGLGALGSALRTGPPLNQPAAAQLCAPLMGEKPRRALLDELWSGLPSSAALTLPAFEQRTQPAERLGLLAVGAALIPATDILDRFTQMNLSTYVFRAPVLYDALRRLRSSRPSQEEYLTDIFQLLASSQPPARIAGWPVPSPEDVMAFNTPAELEAVQAVLQRRATTAPETSLEETATAPEWDALLDHPSAAARRLFHQWYGPDAPRASLQLVVRAFGQRFGTDRPVVVVRSPGRVNLLGRHIDHQGGPVNVLAINREIHLAASARADDLVRLANTDPARFPERSFRISELVASLDWEDWQHVVDGPRLRELLEPARGDWAAYVKAALMRLQEQFRDRRLRGMDILVSGGVPMGAGLSSSSALVVATAEAACALNPLPVSARQLVSLCGEGEWFVGTRGGAADHAAIRLSRRGQVTRVGFFPFAVEDSAPFLPGHELIVCNSGLFAGKSARARQVFNEKVTAYHLGRALFKTFQPDLAPRIHHLRDLDPAALGLKPAAFAALLARLPGRLPRAQAAAAFSRMAPEDTAQLERLFKTHAAPPNGYPVRDVVLFGLSEMARARLCLDLLKSQDAAGLGALMSRSHDGDRVSRLDPSGRRRPVPPSTDVELAAWAKHPKAGAGLAGLAGGYGCSLPKLDHIVDLASGLPGVRGAQLAGAGLGGCVMLVAHSQQTLPVLEALARQNIEAAVFKPIAGACRLLPR